ncbi:MAG TPA: PspC domain-containing protein [Sphingobacteriaceae bacterium]
MEKRLYRNENDKMIAGVCSGLAEYFDMEVTWMRIIFVFAFIFGFSGFIIYLILWVVIPSRPSIPNYTGFAADYRVYEDRTGNPRPAGEPVPTPMPPYMRKRGAGSGNGRLVAGLILIGLGAYFLLDEFDIIPYWVDLGKLWPLAVIILGLLLISRTTRKPAEPDQDADIIADSGTSGTGTTTTTTSTTTTTTNDNPEQPLT